MTSIRKDQPRPANDPAEPASGEGGANDRASVLKPLLDKIEEIEKLKAENRRLRDRLNAAALEGRDPGEADAVEGESGYAALRRELADAEIVRSLMADKEKLSADLADAKDRMMRAYAELQNVQRRAEKEKGDIAKFGISEFARDVIGLGDTIQRAIAHVPADAAANDPALKVFLEGVQLMERELLAALERNGVTRLEPEGEKFDPNKHQAVMEREDATVPSGTVLQVLQPGFMIGERNLRPAVVIVARGGAKVAKVEPTPVEEPPKDVPPVAN